MTSLNTQPIYDTLNAASPDVDWNAFLTQTLAAFDCTTGTLHRLDPATDTLQLVTYAGMPDFLLPKIK